MINPDRLNIVNKSFHRNGIAGKEFTVALVDDANDGDIKLIVMFPTEGHTAVLSFNELLNEEIDSEYTGTAYEAALRAELLEELDEDEDLI